MVEIFSVQIFRDPTDEKVVFGKFFYIGTEKIILERKCVAVFSIDLKIAENLTSLAEFGVVVYLDYCSVKRFVEVTAHLRLAIEIIAGFFFYDLG